MPNHQGYGRSPSFGDRQVSARNRITQAVYGWPTDRIVAVTFLIGREVAAVRDRFATLPALAGDQIISRSTAMRRLHDATKVLTMDQAGSWLRYIVGQERTVAHV